MYPTICLLPDEPPIRYSLDLAADWISELEFSELAGKLNIRSPWVFSVSLPVFQDPPEYLGFLQKSWDFEKYLGFLGKNPGILKNTWVFCFFWQKSRDFEKYLGFLGKNPGILKNTWFFLLAKIPGFCKIPGFSVFFLQKSWDFEKYLGFLFFLQKSWDFEKYLGFLEKILGF